MLLVQILSERNLQQTTILNVSCIQPTGNVTAKLLGQ